MRDAAAPSTTHSQMRVTGGEATPTAPLGQQKTVGSRLVRVSRPILDPRVKLGVDQLGEVLDEFDIAIAWADKPFNRERDLPEQPMIFGQNLRRCRDLLAAALENMTPAPADTLPAIVREDIRQMNETRRERAGDQLALSIPKQSAPAFANKAGPR